MTAATVAMGGPGSAVDAHLLDHLAGPYAGAARRVPVAIDGAGDVAIDWAPRHPLVLAVLRRDLADEAVRVSPTLAPGGPGEQALPAGTFARWSERGASVVLHAPVVPDGDDVVPGFTLRLAVTHAVGDAASSDVAPANVPELIDVVVLEGNLARVLHLVTGEKQRVRRALAEVAAARRLVDARGDALDRIGADLGVERFTDELVSEGGEVFARTRRGGPEPDDAYRHRLGLYRGWLAATPAQARGVLDDLGVRLAEPGNRFAVAVRFVAVGTPDARAHLLEAIRLDRLVWPDPAGDAVHAARQVTDARRAAVEDLRASLRRSYAFAPGAAVAPALAHALDRAGRVLRALGVGAVVTVSRAQDSGGGSRFEAGLAVEVVPLAPADVAAARDAVGDAGRAPTSDAAAEALIAGLQSARVPLDDDGAWLWRACGLQTVHRTSAGGLLLSHLPVAGLVIEGPEGPEVVPPGSAAAVTARFHAPGDPGRHALLAGALAGAAADWAAAGEPPWVELSDADASAARAAAVPASAGLTTALAAAGLPVADPARVAAALDALPSELHETVEIDAGLASDLHRGDPAAARRLRALADLLRVAGVAAVLPIALPGGRVHLVTGVIGLPAVGVNLAERRTTGFRWYVVPLGGATATVKAVGSRTVLEAGSPGVVAIVALGYVRTGAPDPYEVRVEVPGGGAGDDRVLSLSEYEYLMNALTRLCPIGVEINTFALRREHVDLDGDGAAEPLGPAPARTFRTYQRRRSRGRHDPTE